MAPWCVSHPWHGVARAAVPSPVAWCGLVAPSFVRSRGVGSWRRPLPGRVVWARGAVLRPVVRCVLVARLAVSHLSRSRAPVAQPRARRAAACPSPRSSVGGQVPLPPSPPSNPATHPHPRPSPRSRPARAGRPRRLIPRTGIPRPEEILEEKRPHRGRSVPRSPAHPVDHEVGGGFDLQNCRQPHDRPAPGARRPVGRGEPGPPRGGPGSGWGW